MSIFHWLLIWQAALPCLIAHQNLPGKEHTLKFMILHKADADTDKDVMLSEELLSALGNCNMQMAQAGILRTGEGLKPTRDGARINFQQGKPLITDGPFTESKELLAGYTIIEVNSKQEALDWATLWPVEDADDNVELELRELYELSDFSDEPQAETTFNQMAEGGMMQMAFEPTFWAKRFGMLVDHFGTPRMIDCGQCTV